MANNNQTPDRYSMPVRQRWRQTSLANKALVITSTLASLCSLAALGISIYYGNKQGNLDASVATFQAQVQVTADFQHNQQLGIAQTQIAMQSQMDNRARQQGLPLVKVEIPPEHIFTVEKITAEQVASGYAITGEGFLDLILANNGGGKAGLLSIVWVANADGNANLNINSMQLGELPANLPTAIDAQTPVGIKLGLKASIPYDQDPAGKNDYQLGEDWKKVLQANPNHLAVTFSNTDPINIKIVDIQLAMPEVAYQPDPPSPFAMTNKTVFTTACFTTKGKKFRLRIINLANNQSAETTIEDGTCNSFPVGDYQLVWQEPGTNDAAGKEYVSFVSGIQLSISLTDAPTGFSNPIEIKNWGDLVSVLMLVLPLFGFAYMFSFSNRVERITLDFYSTERANPLFPEMSKSIKIFPWGNKKTIRIGGETVTIRIHNNSKNYYRMGVLRSGQATGHLKIIIRELSSQNNFPLVVPPGQDHGYEFMLRKIDDEEFEK